MTANVKEIVNQVTEFIEAGRFDCGNGRGEVTLRDVGLTAEQRAFAREYHPEETSIWDSPDVETLLVRAWEMYDCHSARGEGLIAEVYLYMVDLCDSGNKAQNAK